MKAKKRDSIEKSDFPTLSQIMHKEVDSLYKLSKASINSLFTNTVIGINLKTSNSSATYLKEFITATNQFLKIRHMVLLSEVEGGVGSFLVNPKSFGTSKEKTTDVDVKKLFENLGSHQDQLICLTARPETFQPFTMLFDENIVTANQRVYSMSTSIASIPGENRKIVGLFFIDDSEVFDCGDDVWEM